MSILDSGNRTEFGSGAVRDMQDDKGRCDLMPLDVVSRILENLYDADYRRTHKDIVLSQLYKFQTTKDVLWLYYVLENFIDKAFAGSETTAMLELSVHFRDGAEKYGENNWKKGLPEWSYLSSAVRHYLKWRRGDEDERHDRAFLWNIVCLIWTVENKAGVAG